MTSSMLFAWVVSFYYSWTAVVSFQLLSSVGHEKSVNLGVSLPWNVSAEPQ